MNEYTVGMSVVSADELEQIEGGYGIVFFAGMAIGYGVVKSLQEGSEVVPGLGVFLLGTKAIATAAGARPQ